MEKIKSFQIDHNKLEPGFYISRQDGDIITYDLRTRKPNAGDYMSNIAKSDSIEIPYKIMRVTSVLPSIGGHKQGIGWCIGGIAFSAMLFASSFLDLKKK